MNKSFFINEYDDDKISEIQLSLNRRDNKYIIKDDKLYKNNIFNKNLIAFL